MEESIEVIANWVTAASYGEMLRYVRASITAPSIVVSTNRASCLRSTDSGNRPEASARHCSTALSQPVKFSAMSRRAAG